MTPKQAYLLGQQLGMGMEKQAIFGWLRKILAMLRKSKLPKRITRARRPGLSKSDIARLNIHGKSPAAVNPALMKTIKPFDIPSASVMGKVAPKPAPDLSKLVNLQVPIGKSRKGLTPLDPKEITRRLGANETMWF